MRSVLICEGAPQSVTRVMREMGEERRGGSDDGRTARTRTRTPRTGVKAITHSGPNCHRRVGERKKRRRQIRIESEAEGRQREKSDGALASPSFHRPRPRRGFICATSRAEHMLSTSVARGSPKKKTRVTTITYLAARITTRQSNSELIGRNAVQQ